MPIYEYQCKGCGHQFEFLMLPARKETPVCPECQGQKLERVLSRFAVSSEGTRETNWQSARKKGMKVGREKQIEDARYKQKVLKETDT